MRDCSSLLYHYWKEQLKGQKLFIVLPHEASLKYVKERPCDMVAGALLKKSRTAVASQKRVSDLCHEKEILLSKNAFCRLAKILDAQRLD